MLEFARFEESEAMLRQSQSIYCQGVWLWDPTVESVTSLQDSKTQRLQCISHRSLTIKIFWLGERTVEYVYRVYTIAGLGCYAIGKSIRIFTIESVFCCGIVLSDLFPVSTMVRLKRLCYESINRKNTHCREFLLRDCTGRSGSTVHDEEI